MRTPFGLRRRALDTIVPPDAHAGAITAAVADLYRNDDQPPVPEVAPPPVTLSWTTEYVEWDNSWDGHWTVRPPSTLAAEIEAEHEAQVAWVLSLPDGGGVL